MNAQGQLGWPALGREAVGRIKNIIRPPLFLYFVSIVVGIGGCSVWMELFSSVLRTGRWFVDPAAVTQNVGTYALGIVAAAAIESTGLGLTLPSRSLRMLLLTMSLLAGALALVSISVAQAGAAPWLAVGGALFAWLVWLVANGQDQRFVDEPLEPSNATGGRPSKNLPGTIEDLKVE
jgi:hypothetical protein